VGNKNKAASYISRIDIDSCRGECRNIRTSLLPIDRVWFFASNLLSISTVKNTQGEFNIEKRIFQTSKIKEIIKEINTPLISILSLLGVIYLCSKTISVRTKNE
jgi:hypothetical protein